MLTWKRVDGYWFGNGFRIEREDSGGWVLVEPEADDDAAVSAIPLPMATLPTLSACKYVAEQEHFIRDLKTSRQRLGAVALGTASLAALAANPVLTIALGVVAGAAALELAMTWLTGRVGGAREITQ